MGCLDMTPVVSDFPCTDLLLLLSEHPALYVAMIGNYGQID